MMEEVYGRVWHMGKKRELREYKRSGSRVWEKNEYKSKKAGKVGYDREKRFQELLKKYMVKMLYRWDNEKFEKEYLKKLERN